MAFQMGIQGLFSFKRALKAVEDGDWVDILPSLKEGDSRYCYQELSASQKTACASKRHRAYILSTDCNGKSCRQYVSGRVYVAVN